MVEHTVGTGRRGPGPFTLCCDIGGTGIKMLVLEGKGKAVTTRTRALTPHRGTPAAVMRVLRELAKGHAPFDRVAAGFPGVVRDGRAINAPHLHKQWRGTDAQALIGRTLGHPARVINDADMQGLAVVEGKGVELLLTFGTGVGAGLYLDGVLVPNLELGHHLFKDDETYEDLLSREQLDRVGKKKWRHRVAQAVARIEPVFNYRQLYLGGGNARFLHPEDLPKNVALVPNAAALNAGLALWRPGPVRALSVL